MYIYIYVYIYLYIYMYKYTHKPSYCSGGTTSTPTTQATRSVQILVLPEGVKTVHDDGRRL